MSAKKEKRLLRERYTCPRGSVWIHAPMEHTRNAKPGCLPCWHLLPDHRWEYKGGARAATWTNISHAGKAGCPASGFAQDALRNRWKGRLVTLLAQPGAKLLNTDSMSPNKEHLTFSYISHRWIATESNYSSLQFFEESSGLSPFYTVQHSLHRRPVKGFSTS